MTEPKNPVIEDMIDFSRESIQLNDADCLEIAASGLARCLNEISGAPIDQQNEILPLIEEVSRQSSESPEQQTLSKYVSDLQEFERFKMIEQFGKGLGDEPGSVLAEKIGLSEPISAETIRVAIEDVQSDGQSVDEQHVIEKIIKSEIDRLASYFGKWSSAQRKVMQSMGELRGAMIGQANSMLTITFEQINRFNPAAKDNLFSKMYQKISQSKDKKLKHQFIEFAYGIVNESVVNELLDGLCSVIDLDDGGVKWKFRRSTTEEDTKEGTDFVITTPDGDLRIDAKSRGAFRQLLESEDFTKHDEFFGIKIVETRAGDIVQVLVVNVEGGSSRDTLLLDNKAYSDLPSFKADEGKKKQFQARFKKKIQSLTAAKSKSSKVSKE